MNFDIIIQVRFNSTRLPGKILLNLDKSNPLEILISNLKKIKTKFLRNIIIACPEDEFCEIFKNIAKKNQIKVFVKKKIKENDVLSRYYYCAKKFKSKNIIRITSDCTFINSSIVEKMILYYNVNKLNFLTNNKPRYVPHGFDCEIFSYEILRKAFRKTKSAYDREHVTPYLYRNFFNKRQNNLKIINKNYSKIRITLDYLSDLIFMQTNYKKLQELSNCKNLSNALMKLKLK